ncbi:MAG TPA: hypothetical protein VGN32_10090 [Ktedonobacterales bacterium]|nr:hypothetical protein [Ktedonobacterales bacterium]
MSKAQLLRELADAFEQLIVTATEAAQLGVTRDGATWGPREIVAHLAGWEIMATVRVPRIAAGMAPFEEADETRQAVMDEALNATMVTLVGDQALASLCGILRQAYRQDIAMLEGLDDSHFQPGAYVYERTRGVIEHCQEHGQHLGSGPA